MGNFKNSLKVKEGYGRSINLSRRLVEPITRQYREWAETLQNVSAHFGKGGEAYAGAPDVLYPYILTKNLIFFFSSNLWETFILIIRIYI